MSNEDDSGSSSLDTALLESLFYNEMMLIEDSSSLLSSSLFSSLSADLASPNDQSQAPYNQIDPSTIAEKALLRHFGVTADTIPPGSLSVPPPSPSAQQRPLHQTHVASAAAASRIPSWTSTTSATPMAPSDPPPKVPPISNTHLT